MTKIMKKILFFGLTVWMSVSANAQCAHTKDEWGYHHAADIKIDNIYYQFINDSTVRVTAYDTGLEAIQSRYEGDVIIPEYVTFDDKSLIIQNGWHFTEAAQRGNIDYLGNTFHVTEISEWTFWGHDMNATSISFPSSIINMNNAKIRGAFQLKSITFSEGFSCDLTNDFFSLEKIEEDFIKDHYSLEYIYFPEEGHINIGNNAFNHQVHLSGIRLSNSIHHVGEKAFYNCSRLERLVVGKNVESLGAEAFGLCENISEITVEAETPPTIAENTFTDATYQTATLTVPEGCEEAYRSAMGWKRFFAASTDGIDEMGPAAREDGLYYTIDGISVDRPLKKGIYIHKGKKVIKQ